VLELPVFSHAEIFLLNGILIIRLQVPLANESLVLAKIEEI